jgi:hypothetical protein
MKIVTLVNRHMMDSFRWVSNLLRFFFCYSSHYDLLFLFVNRHMQKQMTTPFSFILYVPPGVGRKGQIVSRIIDSIHELVVAINICNRFIYLNIWKRKTLEMTNICLVYDDFSLFIFRSMHFNSIIIFR